MKSEYKWRELCKDAKLGELIQEPEAVSGGLLHQLFKVNTTEGVFAVKVLNNEIMSRSEAESNYINSEHFAMKAEEHQIDSIPAIMNGNIPWYLIQDQYFMIFPWIDGAVLTAEQCTLEQVGQIGRIIAHIHLLGLPKKFTAELDEDDDLITDELCRRFENDYKNEFVEIEEMKQHIGEWKKKYNNAMQNLTGDLVMSHRDLDFKNVIWKDGKPFIIDWESVGYIHPMIELIEAAINWSKEQLGYNKEKFIKLIKAYSEIEDIKDIKIEQIVYGILGGTIGWLEYNMKRAVEKDIFNEKERRLGVEQVIGTYKIIKEEELKIPEFIHWYKEAVNNE